MKKIASLLLPFLFGTTLFAAAPIIYGPNSSAQLLQPNLLFQSGGPTIVTGTQDPSSVATLGAKGDVFIRYGAGGGNVFTKQDAGVTTNWTLLAAGAGSVSSVGLALPASVFSVAGSPIVGAGTLTGSFTTQTANTVFAGPAAGGAVVPTFRALVAADIPALPYSTNVLTSAHIFVGSAGNVATDVAVSGDILITNAGVTSYNGVVPVAKGGTNSAAALNNNRVMVSSGGAIVENAALTGNRALATTAAGLPVVSATTDTELGYVSGVTSAIQTQLNAKLSSALTSAHLFVGSAGNVATDVALTGDIAITNAGVSSYAGTVPINRGGTGQTTATAAFDALSPLTTKGDVLGHTGASNTRLGVGADGTVLTASSVSGSGLAWVAPLVAWPVSDNTYQVYANADVTKLQKWSLGAQATGTTLTLSSGNTVNRSIAFPDFDGTLTILDAAQTITNHTIPAEGAGANTINGMAGNNFAYADAAGKLSSLPNWDADPSDNTFGADVYITYVMPAGPAIKKIHTFELEVDPAVASSISTVGFTLDQHVDRTGSGNNITAGTTNFSSGQSAEGTGTYDRLTAFNLSQTLGVGQVGTTTIGALVNMATAVGAGYTVPQISSVLHNLTIDATAVVTDVNTLNLGVNGNIAGNYRGGVLIHTGDVGGTYLGFDDNHTSGDVVGNYLSYASSSAGAITGGYQAFNASQSGDTGSWQGISLSQNGDSGNATVFNTALGNGAFTGKFGWNLLMGSGPTTGAGRIIEASLGTGSYNSLIGINLNMQDVVTTAGGVIGLNIGASGAGSVDSFQGLSVNWAGTITGNYQGATLSAQPGTTAIGATGLTVDLTNITTTAQKGGVVINDAQLSVSSNYNTSVFNPSPGFFNLNSVTGTYTVAAGFPVTNTGAIANILGPNLSIQDDVGPDAFGGFLGIALNGFLANTDIATGKTLDTTNGMIAVYSVAGPGTGTVNNANMFTAAGFVNGGGGPVTVVNEIGFNVVNGMCGMATNCWGVKVADAAADNSFAKNVVVEAVAPTNASVGLEVNSTTKAVLFPRMTTVQKNALTAVNGMQVYDTNIGAMECYMAGAWGACATGGGGGSVTSVALADGSGTPIYAISGSPVTTTGTLTFTLNTQAANVVFAGPAAGGAVQPTFRALVAADIPALPYASSTLTDAHIFVGNAGNVATDVAVTGDISITNAGVTAYAGTVPINKGGTGQVTAAAAFNALSPMTTLGDVIYGGAAGTGTRLAGNITAVKQFLSQTGTGAVSAAPVWGALSAADIPAPALTSAHIFVGSAGNVAADVAVTGDIAITNAGVTSYNGVVPTNKGGTGQDFSASTGLVKVAAGVMSAATLVDADVAAAAAIARSKLASGTANHVLINDGAGVMSSEAILAITRGGTGINAVGAAGNVLTSTGAAWVSAAPAAGAESSIEFYGDGPSAPVEDTDLGQHVWLYEAGLSEHLIANFKVPSNYVAGKPLTAKVSFYSYSAANDVLLQSVATLIKKNVDPIDDVTNQRTSTNAALTNTVAKQLREVVLDLTDATGNINAVAVAPGDIIKIDLTRGTDTDTADTYFLPDAAEVLLQ